MRFIEDMIKKLYIGRIFHSFIYFFVYTYMQEEVVKKKYGGILPKKPPLISKVTPYYRVSTLDTYCALCWFVSKFMIWMLGP